MERRDAMKRMALAMGYTLSASTLAGLVSRCSTPTTLDWEPAYLSNDQAATIDALCEIILPATDTPGAKELGVPQFIDVMVGEIMPEKDRKEFIDQFEQLMKDCEQSQGDPFHQCSEEQKKAFLDAQLIEGEIQYPSIWGSDMVKYDDRSFIKKVRDTIVFGYFTSEYVGEQVLAYDPVPGNYTCITIGPDQKSWSL